MSRIGKQLIAIPDGVEVKIDGKMVHVTGPKGELSQKILPGFTISIEGSDIVVTPDKADIAARKYWGLTRSLINNMVVGVSTGFTRELEIKGVGYRAQMQGENMVLSLGFSHQVTVTPPEGVKLAVTNNTQLTVSGYDKQKVGSVAANIRALKKPEPYKGKGIKYVEEHVRRKAGKAAAKGAA